MPVKSISLALALLLAGCSTPFRPQSFGSSADLYQAALRELEAGREDNAIAAFERLQIELSPSDTLLSRVHYRLGALRAGKKQWLLAGQAYLKVPENFPDDTLADDALLAAGHAYAKLWRKPDLDPKYGIEALATYNLLIRAYPSSPHLGEAGAGAAKMREWLAQKDVLTGMHYFRRRAYDSALIYFMDAARNYPGTDGARDALVQMVRTFRVLKYQDDVDEACAQLRAGYGSDPIVPVVCPAGGAAADTTG